MNRTFATALLAYLLVIGGLATLHAPLLALALPLFLYLLVGLWRSPAEVGLQAKRSLSAERVLIGDVVKVTLEVTNSGPALEEVLLEDLVPDGLEILDGSPRHLVVLAKGATYSWTYTVRGRRGNYTLSRLRVTARDHLGLVTICRVIFTTGRLFVVPPVLRLRRVAIQPRRTRVYSGTIPARQGGPGVEFFDVREYQPGDSPHWINWRLTARQPQAIYSNQFEQERVADVGIILDGRRRSNEFGRRSIFEHSVLAAASLADALLNAGNRVGMLFYGKHIVWTFPGYGKLQAERILHDLSRLEPGDSEIFSELYVPRNLFPAHSQLVLVSPLISEDFDALVGLRTRGYHVLVVSPNPASFEVQELPKTNEVLLAARIARLQRRVLLRRLIGAGFQVVDWDVSEPFELVARRNLERRLVLPRGTPQ
jgi:uncharacterized repeat protein (TIGR01451 family)